MTDMEKAIRRMLAEELLTQAVKVAVGYTCTKLARNIDSGQDINPRTIAAISVIGRLLEVTGKEAPGS